MNRMGLTPSTRQPPRRDATRVHAICTRLAQAALFFSVFCVLAYFLEQLSWRLPFAQDSKWIAGLGDFINAAPTALIMLGPYFCTTAAAVLLLPNRSDQPSPWARYATLALAAPGGIAALVCVSRFTLSPPAISFGYLGPIPGSELLVWTFIPTGLAAVWMMFQITQQRKNTSGRASRGALFLPAMLAIFLVSYGIWLLIYMLDWTLGLNLYLSHSAVPKSLFLAASAYGSLLATLSILWFTAACRRK